MSLTDRPAPVGDLRRRRRAEATEVPAHDVLQRPAGIDLGRSEPALGVSEEIGATAVPRPRRWGADKIQPDVEADRAADIEPGDDGVKVLRCSTPSPARRFWIS